MWTSENKTIDGKFRAHISNGQISIDLTTKEYLDLMAGIQLQLGEIDERQYLREICPAWRSQPVKAHTDIVLAVPDSRAELVLRVRRTRGMRVEYRITRDEAADLLASSQAISE